MESGCVALERQRYRLPAQFHVYIVSLQDGQLQVGLLFASDFHVPDQSRESIDDTRSPRH